MNNNFETTADRDYMNPVLYMAGALMKMYAAATGAYVRVYDHNYAPVPELAGEKLEKKNICLFCEKYGKKQETKNFDDSSAGPCAETRVKAMKESYRFGGSYTYACDMGFMFWTSPVYLDGRFIGALLGGGFSGDAEETNKKTRGTDEKSLDSFPRADPKKIKAMAELLLISAKFLSAGSEGFYAAMKRRLEQQANLSAKIEELKVHYPPGSPRPEYPLDKERQLLESVGQGDEKTGREILNEILAFLLFLYPDQVKHIQYRAIELAVLLSRTNTGSGFSVKTVLAANNRNIKSIEGAETIEELTDVLHRILEETARQIRSFHGIQHASALKKAEQYILENFSRKISLDEIAGASGFSAPYFSTIFKEEMGENLSSYLNRLRVKKAAYLLTETNLSLSKIAHACGFEDQSWFSKIFKIYTGTNPGKRRKQEEQRIPKIPEIVFSDEYRLLVKKTKNV